jgi:murein DD-endopeptidase MepM/ murein hydrolase activator NlpD
MNARTFIAGALFCVSVFNASSATLIYQPSPFNGKDVWITNKYSYNDDYGVDNSLLRVGGWGDSYRSAIKFDLDGLPKNATRVVLALFAEPVDGAVGTTAMSVARLANSWDESSGWYTHTWSGVMLGTLPGPSMWTFNGVLITDQYNDWKKGTYANEGLMFLPVSTSNRFNHYRSSDYSVKGFRPYLHITYEEKVTPPSFKLPLPGGRSWSVTTEIGGKDARNPGDVNIWHTSSENAYFSLDFGQYSDPVYEKEIPIYAAAAGTVIESTYNQWNGYYVFINHSGGNNRTTGFVTNYLHMSMRPEVSVGDYVEQGELLGYMGATGIARGKHLHFCIYYNGQSNPAIEELTYVKLEGLCLKQYQTEVDKHGNRVANSYYRSTNTP